jgi:hypothetical protein
VKFKGLKKLEDVMECSAVKDYVKIPKQEYNLLKEVYRTVKRQALLVRIDEAERNLASGKTKAMSVADFIRETSIPKAKRIGIGKLNTPAKRRVLYP